MKSKFVDLMCFFIALFLMLTFTGCGIDQEPVYYKGGTAHFPLLHGRVYRYEARTGSESKEFTMTLSYFGGHSLKLYPLKFDGIKMGNCEFQSEGSMLYYETTQPRTNLEPIESLGVFRELWIREGAEKGDSWENHDTGTQTLFAGYEDATVPAGTFKECYKTVSVALPELIDSLKARHNRSQLSDKSFEIKMNEANKPVARWFALNVGLVKEDFANGVLIRELVSIDQPGVGKEDTTKLDIHEISIQPRN